MNRNWFKKKMFETTVNLLVFDLIKKCEYKSTGFITLNKIYNHMSNFTIINLNVNL